MNKELLDKAKRIVIKVGTNVLRNDDGEIALSRIYSFIALIAFFDTGDDLHQSRFTGAVQTHDTDLRAIEERQIDVFEYHSIVMGKDLSDPVH